jgi:hypothetical protein
MYRAALDEIWSSEVADETPAGGSQFERAGAAGSCTISLGLTPAKSSKDTPPALAPQA